MEGVYPLKDIIKKRFDFHYENDSTASFIVLNTSLNEKILKYQIEMIAKNSCPGILKLDARYKNDDVKLHYNITSKLTLSQFLQRKKLSKDEFIDILLGITKTILDSKEYFLYDKSFLIDEDYIYINPSTLEIGMIYIPLDINTNVGEDFKSFLVNLIISLAKIDEKSNGDYMTKILNYLKNDIFNICDFDCLLKNLKNDGSQVIIKSNSVEEKQSSLNGLDIESKVVNQNKYIFTKPKDEKYRHEESIIRGERKKTEASRKKEIKKEQTTVKKKYKSKNIVIAILSQILIAIILSLSLDLIRSVAGDDISAFGGITLIVVAIDVLLFKKLFNKGNMKEVIVINEDKKINIFHENREHKRVKGSKHDKVKIIPQAPQIQKDQNINMSKREIYNINGSGNTDSGYEQMASTSEPQNISSTNINETIILTEEKQEFACLQRMNNGILDRVSLTKSNFIVGRLSNYVDYLIDDNAIGRTHAEILCREGQYFVKDLNSKNGTFINEMKLNSNKEYIIKNGDKVKFAKIEYTFIL